MVKRKDTPKPKQSVKRAKRSTAKKKGLYKRIKGLFTRNKPSETENPMMPRLRNSTTKSRNVRDKVKLKVTNALAAQSESKLSRGRTLGPTRNLLTRLNRYHVRVASNVSILTSCKLYAAKMVAIGCIFVIDCTSESGSRLGSRIVARSETVFKNISDQMNEWIRHNTTIYLEVTAYFTDLFRDVNKLPQLCSRTDLSDRHMNIFEIPTIGINYVSIHAPTQEALQFDIATAYSSLPDAEINSQLTDGTLDQYFPEKKTIMIILTIGQGPHHVFTIIRCGLYGIIMSSWGDSREATQEEFNARPSENRRCRNDEYEIPTIRSLPASRIKEMSSIIHGMHALLNGTGTPEILIELFGLTRTEANAGMSKSHLRAYHIYME